MRRILSALVLIPLVVYPILYGPLYLLAAVLLLAAALGLWEAFRLVRAIEAPAAAFPLMEAAGYPLGVSLALGLSVVELSVFDPRLLAPVVLSTLALAVISNVAFAQDREVPWFTPGLAALTAVFYVSVPLGLLVWVWRQPDGTFHLLFALIVIWAGDTAGYYVGKNFGKHKSSPRISPNKTWEGTIASFAAALLVGLIAALYFRGGDGYAEPIILAAFLNVAGQFGDLAESGLKRKAGVKDSSHLIPGHGGVLDRLDALLFAAPVLWYYWLWKTS
jgi:phosphatidate cytidylyltransferase